MLIYGMLVGSGYLRRKRGVEMRTAKFVASLFVALALGCALGTIKSFAGGVLWVVKTPKRLLRRYDDRRMTIRPRRWPPRYDP